MLLASGDDVWLLTIPYVSKNLCFYNRETIGLYLLKAIVMASSNLLYT